MWMNNPLPEGVFDARSGPDMASYMKLGELRVVSIMVERFAAEMDVDMEGEIAILVRDKGRDGPVLTAPWVEFGVEGRRFAMWRQTLDIYEIDADGAVIDPPLFRNESAPDESPRLRVVSEPDRE
jgi:hypothetical protein